MLHFIAIVAALGASSVGASPQRPPEPPFEIELRSTALTRGTAVTIGELADITPTNRDSLAIAALKFGPAPVPGYTRTVTRTEVLQALVGAGHAAVNFRMKGASESIVQTVLVEVAADQLVEAATPVLQAVLAVEGGDVETELVARPRNLQAPPGRRSQELRARVRGNATGATTAVVDVEVLVDGEAWRSVPVQFRLARFRNVLKTTASVRSNGELGPQNVALSREPVSLANGLYLSDFGQLAGQIARRNLQPGQILTLSDVGPPAVIHRGEIVTAILCRGRIKATVRAIANHDAAIGQTVSLTNAASRGLIQGTAVAPGTVVVGG